MGLGAVIEGFIITVIITIFLAVIGFKSALRLLVSVVGFLIACIIVGHMVYGRIVDWLINGAFIGVIGAIILWIMSLFKGKSLHSLPSYPHMWPGDIVRKCSSDSCWSYWWPNWQHYHLFNCRSRVKKRMERRR